MYKIAKVHSSNAQRGREEGGGVGGRVIHQRMGKDTRVTNIKRWNKLFILLV